MEKGSSSVMIGEVLNDFRTQTLLLICRHPFARVTDVAAWSDTSYQRVRRALLGLLEADLVGRTSHSTQLLSRGHVYYPQPEGLALATSVLGISVRELARRYPVSVQRMRWIAARLDSAAHIYSLSAALSRTDKKMHHCEEEAGGEKPAPNVSLENVTVVTLYTSGPYDAIVKLRCGGTIGIIRQDPARSRGSLVDDRLRPFFKEYSIARGRSLPYMVGKLLVLVPTGWEAHMISSYLDERSDSWCGPPVSVEPEVSDVVVPSADAVASVVLDLQHSPSSPPGAERLGKTLRLPSRRHIGQMLRSLPMTMSPKEKEVLRVVADLPWISRRDLAVAICEGSKAALSDSHMSGLMSDLVDKHGVIRASGGRDSTTYAPDERGIGYMANQARLRVSEARGMWGDVDSSTGSGEASDGGGPERRSEEPENLTRHRYPEHTQGVYWLISQLKSGIECLWPHYEFQWFLPTHRSRRKWEKTAIEPDGILEFLYMPPDEQPVWVPLMVEYERSAVHAGRARRRLRRYTRYFSSGMAYEDHGAQPMILFVFDTERAESVFLRAASENSEALPIFTSNRETLSSVTADRFMLANAWWTLPLRSGRQPRHSLAGRIYDFRHQLLAWQ